MLIVIEGIDGSGKTTQAKVLIKKLRSNGFNVGTLKFPQYNLFFGKVIKKLLKSELGSLETVNHYLASALYSFDRFQGKDKLQKLLKQNDIVILQRYATSSLIYQSIKERAIINRLKFCRWLEKMEYDILGLPKPNIVIYLYLPTKLCYTLIEKRGKAKELYEKNFEYLNQVNQFGLYLSASKKNWNVILCSQGNKILSKKAIADKVWKQVKKKL